MRAGRLRHRIELQSVTASNDSHGQAIETWATFATVWAAVDPASGKESTEGNQPVGEISHKIKIRYNSAVDIKNRIKFGTRYFDINAIVDFEERNIFQTLHCKEVLS